MEQILDKRVFSQKVEDLVKVKPMPYLDAILSTCDTEGIEPEVAAKLVNRNIMQRLEAEAQDLHLIQGSDKLPF